MVEKIFIIIIIIIITIIIIIIIIKFLSKQEAWRSKLV